MCRVKAVRANLLDGDVHITFVATLDDEMLSLRYHLSQLAADDATVTLTVKEHQMRLPFQLGRDEEGIA